MKISGPGRVSSADVRGVRRASRNRDEAFDAHLVESDDAKVARTGGPPAVGPVDAILAIQAVPDSAERRRRLLARGSRILDRLDEIRLGLLNGGIPRQVLEGLRRQVADERQTTQDPHLLATLDEIELRARVELAKYEHIEPR